MILTVSERLIQFLKLMEQLFFMVGNSPGYEGFPKKCPKKTANFDLNFPGHFQIIFDVWGLFGKVISYSINDSRRSSDISKDQ